MTKFYILISLFIVASCSENDSRLQNTIDLTKSEIKQILNTEQRKLRRTRALSDTTQINLLIRIHNDVNKICEDKSLNAEEKKKILSEFWISKKDSFSYDVTSIPKADASLQNSEFYLNTLISELIFFNDIIRQVENSRIFETSRMRAIAVQKDNQIMDVYLVALIDTNFMEIHSSDKDSAMDVVYNPIKDTNRIVSRNHLDHFTIVNKDKGTYKHAIKVKHPVKGSTYYPFK